MKAETQLIHYLSEAKASRDFQTRFDVRYPDNIVLGGVIIGRDRRIAPIGGKNDQDAASHSFKIRKDAIYDPIKINILTWDRILEFVAPPAQP